MAKNPSPAFVEAKNETTAPATRIAKWRDLELTVPPVAEWDLDVLEALEDDNWIIALRALLGPEQWATVHASQPKAIHADLMALLEAVGSATAGASLGESGASSDS